MLYYIFIIVLINIMLGIIMVGMLWLLYVFDLLLWGSIVMIVNFIFYVGVIIIIIILLLVGLMNFCELG